MQAALPDGPTPFPRSLECWDMLSSSEKAQYTELRDYLATPGLSNRRNHSLDQFQMMLDLVKRYVVRGDADDRRRGYVCGVIWLDSGLAVNIQHLAVLTAKCKSSINSSFAQMGFSTIAAASEPGCELKTHFPFLRNNCRQLRPWTIRRCTKTTVEPDRAEIKRVEPEPDDWVPSENWFEDGSNFGIGDFAPQTAGIGLDFDF